MNRKAQAIIHGAVISLFICLIGVVSTQAAEYEMLNGLSEVKVVFDVRAKKTKTVVTQLTLIHQTYNDPSIRAVSDQPQFAVVFGGAVVKFLSSDTEGFSPEDKATIEQIAKIIPLMVKDGIRFEICLFAADLFGVDPATVLPEIQPVDNGWISLIGYQAKGYSLVAAY